MKKYQLLVFDFDGTLVDTAPDIAHYANQVLGEYGYSQRTLKEVKDAVGLGVHELLKTLAPGFSEDLPRLEEAVERFKWLYREKPVVYSVPYPQVVEMLSGPLASVHKAIVTNKPQDITEKILQTLDLGRYFGALIGMNAGFPAKPDPTALLHVVNQFGVSLDRALYIGDSNVDAETSKNAGVDFAWMSYGYDRLKLHTAQYRWDSAAQWEKDLFNHAP